MSEQTINDLNGNPSNPRTISRDDFANLLQSIRSFGDLSGVVFNETTGQLVGGHQRVEAFKRLPNPTIVLEDNYETPNSVGTVARGYVLLGDEKYTYRVVRWELTFELAANIAANRIQGQFDTELLAEVNYMIQQENAELLALTGQSEDEIAKLLNMVSGEPDITLPDGDKSGFQQVTFSLSDDQAETVVRALDYVKRTVKFDDMENQNSNGNALHVVAQEFINRVEQSQPQTEPTPLP